MCGRYRLPLAGRPPSQAFCLIAEFEAYRAVSPLVYILVVRVTNIGLLSQIAHITNDQRSHACLMQRGDEARGLLVFDLPNPI